MGLPIASQRIFLWKTNEKFLKLEDTLSSVRQDMETMVVGADIEMIGQEVEEEIDLMEDLLSDQIPK